MVALVAAAALAGTGAARAATAPTAPVYDRHGNLVETPFVPGPAPGEKPQLRRGQVLRVALAFPKVADWIARYPKKTRTTEATYDADTRLWTVKVWTPGEAGEIAEAKVTDEGDVSEAWTGPQVAWKMARGYSGAFGRKINDPWIWLGFCLAFLVGLGDLRRPFSTRNLDLVALLFFTASLWFFNEGDVFTAMPLAYPPMLYLIGRLAWIARRGIGSSYRPVFPVWVLLAATVFLIGFRVGLNVGASNVIDVGLSGVVGAQRIVGQAESPYGNMPLDTGKACGKPDADGYIREHVQTNGRCESADPRGDTYGPMSYLAYVPGYAVFGWSGKWDDLPAAHFTSILWDLLAILGLGLAGRRLGGTRLGVTLAFAWASFPFTQYASSSNTNDAIMPALLAFGFWLVTSAPARGLFVGLATWTKFATLLLVPLWGSYPETVGRPRTKLLFVGGFLLATALGFWVLLLEPSPLHAARVFWDRTFGWQLDRPSPFSIWDWGVYRYPDLGPLQTALKALLLLAAVAFYFVPRRKNALQLAALSGVLLVGFELVLTHWSYLYIPWFFPVVALALLAPAARPRREPAEAPADELAARQLVAAG